MRELAERMKHLSSAEDFFQFFGVPYDAHVVHVNRLHILKRFHQYLGCEADLAGLDPVEMFRRYRLLLQKAYTDFTVSSPAQEKVFRIFHRAENSQHIGLDELRASLPSQRPVH